ncbi:unnamed protein product [Durusdinium trenchii]|uniref:Uncharacterized protein n=1 Tax=Durusdinium trenchii TaxID=1381693 RepID=A0ABP0RCY3_9DINO
MAHQQICAANPARFDADQSRIGKDVRIGRNVVLWLGNFAVAPLGQIKPSIAFGRELLRGLYRHSSDEKYWAQIRYAQQLLSRSIGTELALAEASRQQVLEPLFREILDAQEADRMSAITMLSVLNELVSRWDDEQHRLRAASPAPVTPPKNAGKRARPHGSPGSEDRESADELMGDTEAMAQMTLASPANPGTPPQTPQRPQRRFRGGAVSASPCRDFGFVPCTPDRAPRRGFVAQTPEAPQRRSSIWLSPAVCGNSTPFPDRLDEGTEEVEAAYAACDDG